MTRRRSLVVAAAIGLALVAGSTPRLVGDGGEYLAMALNFAALRGPSLAPADLDWIQQAVAETDAGLESWDIRDASIEARDGSRDFVHFWAYPLLAVPPLWIAQALGATPVAAFAALNFVLLGAALWVALPRVGGAAALLLFGGPVVWWLDKPHTEPFTFALLTVAFLLVSERPWWAVAAVGAAATQNPPIAVLVPLVAAGPVVANRRLLEDRRFVVGLAAGLALASLQPAYAYLRHGTPTLLLRANPNHVPSLAELLAVPVDPAVGLLGNFPALPIVVAAAAAFLLARRPRPLPGVEGTLAALTGAVFLFAFAQATNVHHGATPGMSRYALWLVPLSLPLLREANRSGGPAWQRFAWSAAALSAAVSAFAFHPGVPQYTHQPTIAARFVWTKLPAFHNPLPEVFAEIWSGGESRFVPASTPGCEKILLVGRSDGSMFPVPCFPQPVPAECAAAGVLCYANREGDGYRFARAPGSAMSLEGFVYQPRLVWPADAIPHVRELLTRSQWWTLEPKTRGWDVLREIQHVRVRQLEGARRHVFVLRDAEPGARLVLRPTGKLTGVLVDGLSGSTLRTLQFDGEPFDRWTVDVPPDSPLLLISLWAS